MCVGSSRHLVDMFNFYLNLILSSILIFLVRIMNAVIERLYEVFIYF